MQIVGVLVAALAAFAFGAVWYIALSKPWMVAAGIKIGADGKPEGNGSAMPFVIGAIALILVSGMIRHIMTMSGLSTLIDGLMVGFGIGAFAILPWMAMNYGYAMRPRMLTILDGTYAVVGCSIIGVVLSFFI
jgi:Protein of unknown function (DUF1761)